MNKIYFSPVKNIIKVNKDYFKAEMELWYHKRWIDKDFNEAFVNEKNR